MNSSCTHRSNRWCPWLSLVLSAIFVWSAHPTLAQSYSLKTLYMFNGTDSEFPTDIIMDGQRNIFGIAHKGGAPGFDNNGIVYEFSSAGVMTMLASFDGLDGDDPLGSLLLDADGNLWGTTARGGVDWHPEINHLGWGTVFKISSSGVFTPGVVEFTGPHGASPNGNL